MSIRKEPDPRDLRYLKLVTGRLQSRDENDIAADARCESPAALYQQLAQDGFPVCRVCGATHVEEGHCEKSERRARQGEGPRQELPPPAQAICRFERALRALKAEIEALKSRTMYAQDERFVAVEEHRDPIVWWRVGI